jgi:aminoglycoside phosphotransferase (APT) family kinase protein
MAKSPLILAALAKAAVPHLNFHEVKSLSTSTGGSFDTALLTATSGEHYLIRIASNQTAGIEQEVELQALRALSPAVRENLPFKITNLLGQVKDDGGNNALVFEFVYGNPTDLSQLSADSPLAQSIAWAISAIHSLDSAIVEDAHLASFDSDQILQSRVAELDRFAATGKVPAVLLSRWEQALEDLGLFKFRPVVTHGSLSGENLLSLDNAVSGVLSWGSLKISDPAEDFAWIAGTGNHALTDYIINLYRKFHNQAGDSLRVRATLYSELEIARWLMHGLAKKDEEIIADAVSMLLVLAEDVSSGAVGRLTVPQKLAEPFLIDDNFVPPGFGDLKKSESDLF